MRPPEEPQMIQFAPDVNPLGISAEVI